MSTVKTSAMTHPEHEVHSHSSASASSASPSMGQSGELINYGESTDDSDHDKRIDSLARTAAKVHDSLPVPPVPEYYAFAPVPVPLPVPSAPASTPLSPDAVEVDPIGSGLHLHDMRSQHNIADHISAPVSARSGTQPPAPPTETHSSTKTEHRSAPVTASERENVSGPILESAELGHKDKAKKADRDPLDQFGAEIDAQTKAYIFTHGVPSSLYPDNLARTPEPAHHRATSNTFVGSAVAIAGAEHDFPNDSEAVTSRAPVPQSAICDEDELIRGSGESDKAKGEGAGDRHDRDAMSSSGKSDDKTPFSINGHSTDDEGASDRVMATAAAFEEVKALNAQLSTSSSNVMPEAPGSPVVAKAPIKIAETKAKPLNRRGGKVGLRAGGLRAGEYLSSIPLPPLYSTLLSH